MADPPIPSPTYPPATTFGLSMRADGSIWQYAPLESGGEVELWGGPGSETFALGPAIPAVGGDVLPAGWYVLAMDSGAALFQSNGTLGIGAGFDGNAYLLSVV